MKKGKETKKSYHDEFWFEGDGFLENFYSLLWNKDPVFGTIPSVYIPDTVIVRFDEPLVWYFMHRGLIRKKNRSSLTNEKVKEVFLKNIPECGIVAVFISKQTTNDQETKYVFNYLNQQEFVDFFDKKNKFDSGILQKFIQPKGDYNSVIRATWSQNLVFFEKAESLKRINEQKYDVYERAVTFEGEEFHSRKVPLRGYTLPNKLQKICHNIVQHVKNVSFETIPISRLVLNFKIDLSERIYLIYCSSLRQENGNMKFRKTENFRWSHFRMPQNQMPVTAHPKFKLPDDINSQILSLGDPIDMHKESKCTRCLKPTISSHTYEVTYKYLIDGYEYDHLHFMKRDEFVQFADPEENKGPIITTSLLHFIQKDFKLTSVIPSVFKNIYPNLKDDVYKKIKTELSFLNKTTLVCEECIFEIIKSKEGNLGLRFDLSPSDIVGTGHLRPEMVRNRFNSTIKGILFKREIEGLNVRPEKKFKQPAKPAVLENEYGIATKKPNLDTSLINAISDLEESSEEEDPVATLEMKNSFLLNDTAINKNKDSFLRRKTKEIDVEELLFIQRFKDFPKKTKGMNKSKTNLPLKPHLNFNEPKYPSPLPKNEREVEVTRASQQTGRSRRNFDQRTFSNASENRLVEFLANPENSVSQNSTKATSFNFWSRKISTPDLLKTSESLKVVKKIPKLLHLKSITDASKHIPKKMPNDTIDDHFDLLSSKKFVLSSPLSSRPLTQTNYYSVSPRAFRPNTTRKNFAK